MNTARILEAFGPRNDFGADRFKTYQSRRQECIRYGGFRAITLNDASSVSGLYA